MPARIACCSWNGLSGQPGAPGAVHPTEHGSPSAQNGGRPSAPVVGRCSGEIENGQTSRRKPLPSEIAVYVMRLSIRSAWSDAFAATISLFSVHARVERERRDSPTV